jgi:anti-sigma B factor antagonist
MVECGDAGPGGLVTLSLATKDARGWTVVGLTGEIDVATAPQLREYLAGICAGEAGIIVDLTHVSFLDSAALGVLVGAMKRAAARGRSLRLVCPRDRIRDVFALTGLTKVFRIHETLDGASAGTNVPPEDLPHAAQP